MADDSWKDGYDAWKLRSPYDDGDDEPDEGEWREIEIDSLLETVRDLKATIARMQRDLEAAEKWVRNYETAHGPFEREPRIPDFMISF
jgi:hypothetical protein